MVEPSAVNWSRLAAGYVRGREIPLEGLEGWRNAVAPYIAGLRQPVLDLGAGTGQFSRAFAKWFGSKVIALEPARGMREEMAHRPVEGVSLAGGEGTRLPLRDASCGAAWLSNVIHHLPVLGACAAELRRVVHQGCPVLIRSAFPGRTGGITLFRYFPEAIRAIDRFPSVDQVEAVFGAAGFALERLESIPQETSPRLAVVRERVVHRADTALQALSDAEFEAGLARLDAAVAAGAGESPVIDWIDFMVLR